jgi:hypothetical protein
MATTTLTEIITIRSRIKYPTPTDEGRKTKDE